MIADERTRTVTHREWVLQVPVHHSEVAKALAVAARRRETEPGSTTDIEFTCGDDEIVIGYSVAGTPQRPLRECTAHCDDVERDRDEWERRAGFFGATIERCRRLAVHWSAADGAYADTWHQSSADLHATLDGPGDEPDAPTRSDDRPDDLDQFVREQAEQDPTFASEYVKAQHAARIREFEDLLASLWLYLPRHTVKQLTTEQKTLLADSVDAANARLAEADPAYGEPARVERWWAE